MNWSAEEVVDVPSGFVTVTSTVAAPWLGETAVMEESELMVKLGAATEPKSTTLLPVKFVPLMVTRAPPAVVPPLVSRPTTVGLGSL